MANKVLIRMVEDGISLKKLESRSGVPVGYLRRYLLSGDGQRTPEEDARSIADALGARISSLFIEDGDGWLPRLRK